MTLDLSFRIDSKSSLERKLLRAAVIFLFIYAVILTLAPAARLHSWQADYPWRHWVGLAAWFAGFWWISCTVNRRLPEHDPYILPIVALLSGWGLMTIWRLDTSLGLRQTLWLTLGFLIIYAITRFQDVLGILRRYKYIWLSGGLLLTVLTFFFGSYPGGVGPRLWLGCCGIYFQPSEPLKILLIAYLAAYLADQMPLKWSLIQLLAPTLIVASAATILLIAQRDLGTATLLIVIYTLIIYMASGRRRILGIASAVVLIAFFAGYVVFDVIHLRVDSWINPWLDPYGKSYQIVQSLISIASGRLLGSGPGMGSPNLVPVASSDFIATAISEETGFLGISGLILLFSLLFLRGLTIAVNARTSYQRFLASGLSAYFATQAIFILGGNLRLLPLTGVTLPFVSYGGSSLVTAIFAASILLIISSQQEGEQTVPLKPRPYVITAAIGLAGFLALTLLAGWWSIIRSENLQFRPDNYRWAINERYVQRGSLLDRDNQPITISEGKPGEYNRVLIYPDLGNTIGYNHPLFGKAGLEASLDAYLTGLKANPASTIWLNELIYSQPPPGLDVRLTIDLAIQNTADDLLRGHIGALVLLNASTGEILTLASHPSYDPNQMDQNWEIWNSDPNAPLLNRATQGVYPPGAALGPFLYTLLSASETLPETPGQLTLNDDGDQLNCAFVPDQPNTWESVLSAGCPGAVNQLALSTRSDQLDRLYRSLGFHDAPQINLPVAEALADTNLEEITSAVVVNEKLRISPLQMALAASAMTNQGEMHAPWLAAAVNTPHQGWVVLPSAYSKRLLDMTHLSDSISTLAGEGSLFWQTTALAYSADEPLTWFVGGTVPDWSGAPLAVALIIEEDNPRLARTIGESVLQAAMNPH